MIQFERLYARIVKYEMELPEAVRAYFLLNAANMFDEDEKLARTTCGDLKYNNMRDRIMKIFGDPGGKDGGSGSGCVPVKQECLVGFRNNKHGTEWIQRAK